MHLNNVGSTLFQSLPFLSALTCAVKLIVLDIYHQIILPECKSHRLDNLFVSVEFMVQGNK
jgi:hypothetical protein